MYKRTTLKSKVYTEVRFVNCEEIRPHGKEGAGPEHNKPNMKRQYSKGNWKRYHTRENICFCNKNADTDRCNSNGVWSPKVVKCCLLHWHFHFHSYSIDHRRQRYTNCSL